MGQWQDNTEALGYDDRRQAPHLKRRKKNIKRILL
jgi:hypothetical protein